MKNIIQEDKARPLENASDKDGLKLRSALCPLRLAPYLLSPLTTTQAVFDGIDHVHGPLLAPDDQDVAKIKPLLPIVR